ncbi:hybrid sensor histidine kinase/response regulator [Actinoplanes friuliensis]|uniref:histidine kinase n=1 Tax=Actinoplanes friuliensis DSM 7358 TaxID=1246995 RepID=U5VSP3_9ACTN|nr:ATP-binding protein [Actinoplanes friuliensis]AGZ39832.1 PAS/PAC sensor hybrid histidine kinase [Actinoplanes friuliensis DSM 7358]
MEWSEELSSGLLQAAPDAILVMDEGRIVLVNDRAVELFGWPRAELLGQHAQVLLTEAGRASYPDSMRRDPAGPEPEPGLMGTISVVVRRRDNTEFPAEASLARVQTPQGRLAVAVVRDMTERQQLQAEADLQRSEVQEHRNQRLEALGQLAGGIAHDFNNMLGVIVNYANFVIEEAESPEPDLKTIAADARQVIRAGERGTDLTHQLLKFARREVVRPVVLDLNSVITDVEELLRHSIGEHITLITRPAEVLPPVTCDPGQIEQLLVNLAVNARDAMPSGGNLVIDTACSRLEAGEHTDLAPGDYVRLRISDSGQGMPPDVVERAFEPFFTTKANGEGTGLGLATVYGIVTQAGGSVSLTSEPGLGTTVTVLLPAGAIEQEAAPVPAPVLTAGHGETLLVVEDEAALRDVAGRILSGAGYRVLAADGGSQALELAALHEGTIDLLVSDVVMPGMLGKELAERLTVVRPDTRVLYMSGYAQPVLASQGTLEPGVALLEKPFTAADLLSAVRRRLDG